MTSLKRSFTFLILLILATLAGCNKPNEFQTEFSNKFPKPEWFEETDAPSLNSPKELTALWRSEERSGSSELVKKNFQIMYKSCYNAIYNNYMNDSLVVSCIPKMAKAADTEQRHALWKYLVENYGDFKQDITRCSNCMEADKISRATVSLARYEFYASGESNNSISLIENLMDKRGKDISPYKQAEMFNFLGSHYLKQGVTPDVKTRYKNIHAHHLKSFEKTYQKIMAY